MLTKDQLVQYLRVCADLADSPKDGIAHVAIVPLRQVIQLLESSPEPSAPHIKTWRQRCDEIHDDMVIVTDRHVQQRMQEEIDDLRRALNRRADGPYGGVRHTLDAPPCTDPSCPICGGR